MPYISLSNPYIKKNLRVLQPTFQLQQSTKNQGCNIYIQHYMFLLVGLFRQSLADIPIILYANITYNHFILCATLYHVVDHKRSFGHIQVTISLGALWQAFLRMPSFAGSGRGLGRWGTISPTPTTLGPQCSSALEHFERYLLRPFPKNIFA